MSGGRRPSVPWLQGSSSGRTGGLPTLLALVVRLGGANLDGAVARARGVSRWGFVLNEIGDHTSDFLAFAGLADLAARLADIWPIAGVVIAGSVITALVRLIAAHLELGPIELHLTRRGVFFFWVTTDSRRTASSPVRDRG